MDPAWPLNFIVCPACIICIFGKKNSNRRQEQRSLDIMESLPVISWTIFSDDIRNMWLSSRKKISFSLQPLLDSCWNRLCKARHPFPSKSPGRPAFACWSVVRACSCCGRCRRTGKQLASLLPPASHSPLAPLFSVQNLVHSHQTNPKKATFIQHVSN